MEMFSNIGRSYEIAQSLKHIKLTETYLVTNIRRKYYSIRVFMARYY